MLPLAAAQRRVCCASCFLSTRAPLVCARSLQAYGEGASFEGDISLDVGGKLSAADAFEYLAEDDDSSFTGDIKVKVAGDLESEYFFYELAYGDAASYNGDISVDVGGHMSVEYGFYYMAENEGASFVGDVDISVAGSIVVDEMFCQSPQLFVFCVCVQLSAPSDMSCA